ncbi:ABC transporter substrate-binding protein [Dolichospermum circinale CS-541/06]|nr:ABC transporter substrate-binding protein [Dolichospermum circinale CS-541/06]MDB9463969.1 ABC transporter substrate-binding protein [Dolichospermum circinale CS-541/04]MDB9548894.1 ABC transporter substrate-binding protein [Dolichospermum circinale CS-1031]
MKMRNFRIKIRKGSILIRGLSLILLISFVTWGYWIINPKFIQQIVEILDITPTWCKNFELNDNLSCGEESLFTQEKFPFFLEGKFQQAVDFFSNKRKKDQNNPETLIYLNNAKLMQKGRKSYTIAVVIPINQDARDVAESILRGAAKVQEDFNQNTNYPGLKIVIVNDANEPKTVNDLAQRLLSKDDIVAVMGHYTSELTQEVLPVYQQKEVVVISSSATALRETILDGKKYPKNFFFRTVPSVKVQTPMLIEKLQLFQLNSKEKVAIFYTPTSAYSKSAFEEFRNQLGVNKIIERDISISDFIANKTLNEVKKQGAKALILIPDGRVNSNSIKNTLSLIDVNQDQLPMAGQSVLYDTQILNRKNIVKNLFLITHWHRLTSPNQEVIRTAKEVWGTSSINDQTAMSYDATLVLTKALEKVSIKDSLQKQRLDIREQLTTLKVTEGASGTISFDDNGDRKENISQILRVVSTECSTFGATFVPINYDLRAIDCL